jgi:hypothetical protein
MLEKLQHLVDGPLLLVGDSQFRQHFWSIGCDLGEHVLWRGVPLSFDADGNSRSWRMHRPDLVLDPASPLLPLLRLPPWFVVNSTALVSYQLQYTPLSREEMRTLAIANTSLIPSHIPDPNFPVYEASMNFTQDLFLDPAKHYRTMLFSSMAHFAADELLFPGFTDPTLISIFRAVLRTYYASLSGRMRSDQRVIVRAAGVGHSDCFSATGPLPEVGA